jgi:hypothetical protein
MRRGNLPNQQERARPREIGVTNSWDIGTGWPKSYMTLGLSQSVIGRKKKRLRGVEAMSPRSESEVSRRPKRKRNGQLAGTTHYSAAGPRICTHNAGDCCHLTSSRIPDQLLSMWLSHRFLFLSQTHQHISRFRPQNQAEGRIRNKTQLYSGAI